jgi:hypothetical protein
MCLVPFRLMAPPLQLGVVGPYLARGTQDTRPRDLAASVSFGEVVHGMTPASKLKLPLMKFRVVCSNDEDDIQCFARVELEAENVVGSYSCPEHEACVKCLPNRGWLNHVFELARVVYRPRLKPGTEAHTEASKKRKVDAQSKTSGKRAKAPMKKKVGG